MIGAVIWDYCRATMVQSLCISAWAQWPKKGTLINKNSTLTKPIMEYQSRRFLSGLALISILISLTFRLGI